MAIFNLSYNIAEQYPILIRCQTLPCINTLPNFSVSEYDGELYPILIHYRIMLYTNTLLNYLLS